MKISLNIEYWSSSPSLVPCPGRRRKLWGIQRRGFEIRSTVYGLRNETAKDDSNPPPFHFE